MGAIACSNNDKLLEDQENNKACVFHQLEYSESKSKQALSLGGDLSTLEAWCSYYIKILPTALMEERKEPSM